MRKLALFLLFASAAARAEDRTATEKELVDDDGYVVRLSRPTMADRDAWALPGLQVGLGVGGGMLWGRGTARNLGAVAFSVRALARLDRTWSLGLDLEYASASRNQLSGLRFGGLVEALVHPWEGLAVGAGLGFGGLSLSQPGPAPAGTVGRTLRDDETLGACDGDGAIGRIRAEYLYVVGPLFATGPYLQADAQMTRCQSILVDEDGDTGRPVALTQWWLNRGLVAGWWFTWR